MLNDPTPSTLLAKKVGAKAERKLRARRDNAPGIWFGLGTMGLIGWSVVVPTLLGAALGIWLDARHPGKHPWSLALLMAGLVLGCLNAWRWVAQQDSAMHTVDDPPVESPIESSIQSPIESLVASPGDDHR